MGDLAAALHEHGVRWCVNPKRFNVAGLLWTYQCTIACRHCLFACRPERPHVVMAKEDCLAYLRVFHRLPRVIHLAGGECTIFYDEMLALFGEANVIGSAPDESRGAALERMSRDEDALREHVRAHPPQWMTGNAYRHLARYLDKQPIEAFETVRCAEMFDIDRTWEFHFDPYGNLQTNCGIVLGNARRTPPAELLTQANLDANPVVQVVCEAGPVGLLRMAIERGLEPRGGYVAKCELCYHARLHLRRDFPRVLCPDEVYGL